MKNTIKKLVLLACLAMLVLAFVGCTNDADEPYSTDAQQFGQNQTENTGGQAEGTTPEVPTSEQLHTPALALVSYELTIGDIVLSAPEYNFYFIEFMYQVFEMYFHQFGFPPFDLEAPLEEQMHPSDEETWADYVHRLVESELQQYARARSMGTQLSERELDFLEENEIALLEFATLDGMTIDEYVGSFFADMTGEMFISFLERELVINIWRMNMITEMAFEQQELEAFFYENWEDFAPWSNGQRGMEASSVDARHILVMFSDDYTEAESLELAEAILAEWKAGEATEDSFAALATERTDDWGSADTGGLYSNIWQGQMVPEFDAWIFDPSREFGDTDIVETDFGFHIMFFVQSNVEWEQSTRSAMMNMAITEIIEQLSEDFPATRRAV